MDKNPKRILYLLLAIDLLLIISISIFSDDPKKYFKELQLFTWLSFIKLLIISYINWKAYNIRRPRNSKIDFNKDHSIWFIISSGFLFLALDEVLLIHENTDKIIHKILKMKESGLTDRIDDLIVLIYALLGILILYSYRKELLKFAKSLTYLVIGFFLLFLRIIIDFITNRNDVIPNIISNAELIPKVNEILALVEGSTKLLAETFFIFAFYICLNEAKNLNKKS